MQLQNTMVRVRGRAGLLAALLLLSALSSLILLAEASAQEPDTVVRIEVDADQPIAAGAEFEARVVVEDVSSLAGFDFLLEYDPERIRPVEEETSGDAPQPEGTVGVQVLDVGDFVTANGDRQDMICDDPHANLADATITVSCVTVGPPVCLGGATGATGSGTLGRVLLESRGGGETTLALTTTTLVLDDVDAPCAPDSIRPVSIEHRNEDLTIELSGSESGSNTGLIIAIIVGVLIAGGAGVAGLVWYSRRRAAGL